MFIRLILALDNFDHRLINWETGLRNDRDYAWAAMSAAKV